MDGARGDSASGFANIPFDGMQTITAVRDMRHPDIFAPGQEVINTPRDQRAERNLEAQRSNVDVVVAAGGRMQIETVVSDTDGIGEALRFRLVKLWKLQFSGRDADMLFENGKFGLKAP